MSTSFVFTNFILKFKFNFLHDNLVVYKQKVVRHSVVLFCLSNSFKKKKKNENKAFSF